MRKLLRQKNAGFTLIEIIVAMIILATLLTMAWPRYTTVIEKMKAQEGVQILQAVYGARKRAFVDRIIVTSLSDLDITIPASRHFAPPTLTFLAPKGVWASINRVQGGNTLYTLNIDYYGTLTCTGSTTCSKLGF